MLIGRIDLMRLPLAIKLYSFPCCHNAGAWRRPGMVLAKVLLIRDDANACQSARGQLGV
jgi:hypothetical protein